MKQSEVIIIGGGPAGASAALYLKQYGFNIRIIEKKTFPRETLCGEFLSIEVVNALKELNLFEDFLTLQPNKIKSFSFFNSNGKGIQSDFSFDAYGLKRSTFDNFLLNAAKDAGVEILQPIEVTSIKYQKNKFMVEVKDDNGNICELSSGILIGAYGKQNILDKNLERHFVNHKSGLIGVKFHLPLTSLKKINTEEIHIYASDGIYCGVNAVNDNAVTFCFLQNRNLVHDSPKEQIINLINNNPAFSSLFNNDNRILPDKLDIYGTGNIYFGKKKSTASKVFLIGDAAGVIAPLAGDGIGMAFESSRLLCKILNNNYKPGAAALDSSLIQFDHEWENLFSARLRAALLIQKVILNRYLRNVSFEASRLFPALIGKAIKATRNI